MSQFILRLEQADLVTINEALAAQPLGKVFNTFLRIQQQVQEQTAGQERVASQVIGKNAANGAQQVLEE